MAHTIKDQEAQVAVRRHVERMTGAPCLIVYLLGSELKGDCIESHVAVSASDRFNHPDLEVTITSIIKMTLEAIQESPCGTCEVCTAKQERLRAALAALQAGEVQEGAASGETVN